MAMPSPGVAWRSWFPTIGCLLHSSLRRKNSPVAFSPFPPVAIASSSAAAASLLPRSLSLSPRRALDTHAHESPTTSSRMQPERP
uniref:Uncharacterized protein n=1 Tax=Oryza brachyantha TaxID=4533 RepID=J3LDY1_ORYBR